MTKADLVERMAQDAGISKVAADEALKSFIEGIKEAMRAGTTVTMVGFGTFSVSQRKARRGRNPQTGDVINIPASRAPKFRPSQALREAAAG